MANEERSRPPPPPPRDEDPDEAAAGEAARARVERFVVLTLVAAFALFAWMLLRSPVRAPSPGVDAPPTDASERSEPRGGVGP